MPKETYIDAGDKVRVTNGVLEDTHKRKAKPDLVGKNGVVLENDGWGWCTVRLEDGTTHGLWNGKDLELIEDE